MTNRTSPEERQRLIRQKLGLKRYLPVLSALIGRTVDSHELESLEKTDVLHEAIRERVFDMLPAAFEIPFAGRLSDRFAMFVRHLYAENSSPVYVWAERAWECGIFIAPSICSIRFDFEFTVDPNGVFSFSTIDMRDRLMLDFYVSENGEESLICEVQGPNWGKVTY